jgi:hypothetical protein
MVSTNVFIFFFVPTCKMSTAGILNYCMSFDLEPMCHNRHHYSAQFEGVHKQKVCC